jgi:hypothetical protein
MADRPRNGFKSPVVNWIDARLPVFTLMQKEYGTFPTPKNFNYLWNFGALATVALAIMIVTGVFLAMNYQLAGFVWSIACITTDPPAKNSAITTASEKICQTGSTARSMNETTRRTGRPGQPKGQHRPKEALTE